ncbi:hypothetical protein B0H63DRAFT_469813 [Podospora didyma]|uniref:Heterokaryon incompatibility domain-containing protein n=1 Tax=Podospora didyma TaxID=330526 RepID=A0AAE0NTP5_9PEZI|nr:hypothetical protein B0H63DRAFT_469813 [Podospora didyma]
MDNKRKRSSEHLSTVAKRAPRPSSDTSPSSLLAKQYQYKPLENSDIRLITILPAKSIEDDILIRIAHVPLLGPQQHVPTSGMSLRDVARTLPPHWKDGERTVKRMSDIYRLAHRVVVWLGPRTPDSKHALDTLEYLGKQVVVSTNWSRMPAPDAAEPTWYKNRERLPYDQKTWRAIGELLSRDWFERM